MPNSLLIDQVKRLKRAQATRETQELERLVRAYGIINQAAARQAEALADKIALQFAETGKYPTTAQIQRLTQYRELMNIVDSELTKYEAFMRVEMSISSRLALTEGERDARILARLAAQDVGLTAAFRALNPSVIEQLVGFLDPRGPLYKRLGMLSGWTADQVSRKIIEGVGLGLNPRVTARMLAKKLTDGITDALGMGLTDSMRMMRTVQLWSYREANRASYVANADVVRGWVWMAELDSDVCGACLSMHGSVHPLDENLDGHHNCRCAMVPVVIGSKSPIEKNGSDWFKEQSEQTQRELLGPSKFEAYKEGKFELSQLSELHDDPVYGQMRSEASLASLLGE